MTQKLPPIIFLVGATASGKAKTAAVLSRLTGGYRLVSLDSMKVYRGMRIGTACPAGGTIGSVAIAMTEIVEPTEAFSVGRYLKLVAPLVDHVRRGDWPGIIFVGGTALYVRMMVEGAFEGPAADHALRDRLKEEARREGTAGLHDRLKQVDPVSAERIHPNDLKRIVRALEVYELTGRPLSAHHGENKSVIEGLGYRIVVLNHPREILYRRIDERVDRMMAEGFLEEVHALREKYGMLGPQARYALGYPELAEHLNGKCSREEAVELTKQHTRNFAKHQLTWFRNMPGTLWVDVVVGDTAESAGQRIMDRLAEKS